MTFILLTGAGFSHNWGGWLANEAFEYLLGCPEIDSNLRDLLWKSKINGNGFEDALAQLQSNHTRSQNSLTEKPLKDLQAAIVGMFNDMDGAFARTDFEPQQHQVATQYMVRAFLSKFDAIFTLNQDLLLERHYLNDSIMLSQPHKWNGWYIPGMKIIQNNSVYPDPTKNEKRTPDPANFKEQAGLQPYFKLHGSSNWLSDAGNRLLIMGGNKAVEINQYPVLSWYHQQFKEYLLRPNTRLMVIGYSFGDDHINETIGQAADKGGLRLFIIDPKGVEVLDKQNPRAPIRIDGPLMNRLNPHIFGASRRPLTATFAHDRVEHSKVMRFFAA